MDIKDFSDKVRRHLLNVGMKDTAQLYSVVLSIANDAIDYAVSFHGEVLEKECKLRRGAPMSADAKDKKS